MKKEYLYAILSILLWSTTATVTKLLLNDINSMQIILITSFFSFLFLFIVNLFKGNLKELKTYKLIDYFRIAVIGILGTFLYNLFLFLGIDTLKASQALIINYLWPIITVIFAALILKEKLTKRNIFAIILSFIGVIFVASNGDILHIQGSSILGMTFCILSAMSYGLFSILNKKQTYNKYTSIMLFYFTSFCIALIYAITTKNIFIPAPNQLMGLLWIGIFTSAIAFTSWVIALDKGNVVRISNMAYITPFLSLIWTNLILKENFSIFSFIGLILIISGIFIQMKKSRKIIKDSQNFI